MQTYSVFPNQAQDGGGDGVVSDIFEIHRFIPTIFHSLEANQGWQNIPHSGQRCGGAALQLSANLEEVDTGPALQALLKF